MSEAPAWWATAKTDLVQEQEKSLEKYVGPIRQEVKQIKTDVSTMKSDITDLKKDQSEQDARIMALEAGTASTGGGAGYRSFRPTYVDILGFCKFDEKEQDGINRPDAVKLVETLKSLLDPTLKQHVWDIELRSGRNYSVRVPITPTYVNEVKNTWNDWLCKDENKYKTSTKLRVRAQPPPDVQKRWEVFGKVSDWVHTTLGEELEPRPFWAPDYKIMINKSSEEGPHGVKPACLLCEVAEGGTITWNPLGLQVAGLPSSAHATTEALKYRRRQ